MLFVEAAEAIKKAPHECGAFNYYSAKNIYLAVIL